jgi:CheY-like chemotaxis protein
MLDGQARYLLENISMMVIDDNKHMSMLVGQILHALGVKNVCQMHNAEQAFEELKHFVADVIIVDWHMQPMDGIEFVRRVRTAPDTPNPHVPIIMLSGFTERQRVIEARDAGINEFLAKPVSPKSLYQHLAKIIDNPRPFVRTKSYFGPDRRRKNLGPPKGTPERRKENKKHVISQS